MLDSTLQSFPKVSRGEIQHSHDTSQLLILKMQGVLLKKIQTIIINSLKKYSEQSSIKLDINDITNTPIFGEDSMLDSLGLVTLLVEIEQNIEDEC